MSAVRESQKRKREALLVEIETRTLRRQQANSHDTTIRTYQPVLVQSSSPSLLCPSPLQSLFEMSVPSSPGITRLVILVLLFSILCLLAQSFPTVSKTYLKSRSTYASVMEDFSSTPAIDRYVALIPMEFVHSREETNILMRAKGPIPQAAV
jgi:hypothetical protein